MLRRSRRRTAQAFEGCPPEPAGRSLEACGNVRRRWMAATAAPYGAAGQNPRIAKRFVEGFDDPRDFFDWFMTPDKAEAYLAEVAA